MQPAFFSQLNDFHSNHHNTQRATDCTTLYILFIPNIWKISCFIYNPKTSSFHLRLVARVYMVCFRCYSFVLLLNQLIQPWKYVWSVFIISVFEWKFIFFVCYFPPFYTENMVVLFWFKLNFCNSLYFFFIIFIKELSIFFVLIELLNVS